MNLFRLAALALLGGLVTAGCSSGDDREHLSSEACAAILTNPVAEKTAPKDYQFCMDRIVKALKVTSE
jgi:hypothetical protein